MDVFVWQLDNFKGAWSLQEVVGIKCPSCPTPPPFAHIHCVLIVLTYNFEGTTLKQAGEQRRFIRHQACPSFSPSSAKNPQGLHPASPHCLATTGDEAIAASTVTTASSNDSRLPVPHQSREESRHSVASSSS